MSEDFQLSYRLSPAEIATVAHKVLDGELGIVEGCRLLASLASRFDVSESDALKTIIVVESETEALPVGEFRSQWHPESLAKKDAEFAPYIEKVRPLVLEACRALVQEYSAKGSGSQEKLFAE